MTRIFLLSLALAFVSQGAIAQTAQTAQAPQSPQALGISASTGSGASPERAAAARALSQLQLLGAAAEPFCRVTELSIEALSAKGEKIAVVAPPEQAWKILKQKAIGPKALRVASASSIDALVKEIVRRNESANPITEDLLAAYAAKAGLTIGAKSLCAETRSFSTATR